MVFQYEEAKRRYIKCMYLYLYVPLTLVSAASFQDNLSKPVPECQTILDFAAARDDGGGNDDKQIS